MQVLGPHGMVDQNIVVPYKVGGESSIVGILNERNEGVGRYRRKQSNTTRTERRSTSN